MQKIEIKSTIFDSNTIQKLGSEYFRYSKSQFIIDIKILVFVIFTCRLSLHSIYLLLSKLCSLLVLYI